MKSNAERQLEFLKEICILADKVKTAHAADETFYIQIAQQYVLHLKEIQAQCHQANDGSCSPDHAPDPLS